jgi:hypothetical protein
MNKLFVIIMLAGLCVIAAGFGSGAVAQDAELYRIETADGNVYVGELISENAEFVVLLTESSGELRIRRASIIQMTRLVESSLRQGDYWYANPNPTRYLFAPGARNLEKGQGYYQNTWIFLNSVDYGISDRFSLGIGTIPTFLFGGAAPVWLIPKLSFPAIDGKLHLSGRAVIAGIVGAESDIVGIFYGAATYGSSDKNVTIGLGYGYSDRTFSSTPVLNISGMYRVSRKGYLISENYLFPGTDGGGIISAAYRYTTPNASLDFGLLRPTQEADPLIGIPWLGVTIPFGR